MSRGISSCYRFVAIILLLTLIAPAQMACRGLGIPIVRPSNNTSTHNPFEPKPPNSAPRNGTFQFWADDWSIKRGGHTTLHWDWTSGWNSSTESDSDTKNFGFPLGLPGKGDVEVHPSKTTKYTLINHNIGVNVPLDVTVAVQDDVTPPPVTPPPVTPPPRNQDKPDLTVTSVHFLPYQGKAGDTLDVTFIVKNQGKLASGPFYNRISLATTQWGTNYSLGNFFMDSVDPGEYVIATKTTKAIGSNVPVLQCYWVTVFTDGFQEVDEGSAEYNNIGSSDPDKFEVTP